MWSRGDVVVARCRSGDGRFRGGLPLTVVDDRLVAYLASWPVAELPSGWDRA
jgi:hypothetical protein